MQRRFSFALFAATLAVGVGLDRPAAAQSQANARPNVVVLLADDLGYADIGAQGRSSDVRTPNIDSLAKAGTRFTDGYVTCPVCSPTRAGFITGKYQERFGHEFNPGPNRPANFGLPRDQTTIGNAFKQNGYATGLIGKWHLGFDPGLRPQDRGFDEFFGFLGGAHKFIGNEETSGSETDIFRGNKAVAESSYLTDAVGREASAFIDHHAKEPFFLYVPFNDVHNPQQAPAKYTDRFPNETDPKRKQLLAKLSALDDAVGVVLNTLRQNNLEENTLIVFFSDNGGPTPGNGSRNTPLSGYKGQVLEGGIRVPFIVQWKAKLPQGQVLSQPIHSLDIFPTALAAIGGKTPSDLKLDGKNLLPLISGQTQAAPHEALFWRFGAQWAVRSGNLKFVHRATGEEGLYDLANDIAEQNDLSAKQPEDLKRLKTLYANWNGELTAPLWRQEAAARQTKRAAKLATAKGGTTQPAVNAADAD
ncbi:MAG: sulfatase-like hydrolase/transferase [Tepidisphaeraceae bacterium]